MTSQAQPDTTGRDVKAAIAAGYRRVAPGWHRWRREFLVAGAEITAGMMEAARPRPGMAALDVACGAGEAAFALASLIEDTGRVIGVDLVAEMLPQTPAAGRGVAFYVADAEALPFGDGGFDLVTSRLAVMHFPNPRRAAAEAFRVLRPGGRCVISTLGPAAQETAVVVQILVAHGATAPASLPLPDLYELGGPGALATLLASAGFRSVEEWTLACFSRWPGDAEQFWRAMPEHGFRVAELVESLTPDGRRAARAEIVSRLRRYEIGGTLHLPVRVALAAGVRDAT
jgi:ubiquinone/menaquinone biosynthesis C-methylase UbiE